jgi:hypothetical protein
VSTYANFIKLPYEETYNNDIQSCNSVPISGGTFAGSRHHMDDLSRATNEVTNASALNKPRADSVGGKPTVINDDGIEMVSDISERNLILFSDFQPPPRIVFKFCVILKKWLLRYFVIM